MLIDNESAPSDQVRRKSRTDELARTVSTGTLIQWSVCVFNFQLSLSDVSYSDGQVVVVAAG
jgi:hypothetical protein